MKSLLFTLLLAALAPAAESVTLAWDASPAAELVQRYRLTYVSPPLAVRTVEVATTQVTVPDLPPGVWQFSVAAINRAGTSPESAVVLHTVVTIPNAPRGLRVVEIQTSANLQDWETIALIPQDPAKAPAEFVRARVKDLREMN